MRFSLPTGRFARRTLTESPLLENRDGQLLASSGLNDRELVLHTEHRGGVPLRERWQTEAALLGIRGIR